jgi:CRP-like cAMP-binding protein
MEKIKAILLKRSENRSSSENSSLLTFFSNYLFFQDLEANDESGATLKEVLKSLSIEKYDSSSCLRAALYIILDGWLIVDTVDFDTFQTTQKKGKALKSILQDNFHLEPGSVFGDVNRSRNYNVTIKQPVILAVLHPEVFEDIQEKQEILLLEKIDFLKNLEFFRNWSRKALNTAARAFEKRIFKRNEIVFKEGDEPDGVYIVVVGEFKLSQKFIPRTDAEEDYEFGAISFLKGKKIRDTSHKSELQIVIKQKDEIFGFSEILEEKPKREVSCFCHSKKGELLFITQKEFNKKFSHPETLKNLKEQNNVMQRWTSKRLRNLQNIEKFKSKLSYTPKSLMKITKKELTPNKKSEIHITSLTPTPKLPKIFMNILHNTKTNKREKSFLMFPTEYEADIRHLRY